MNILEGKLQKIYNSVTEMVGRTPLVNLSRLAKKFKVKANILAKCEFYNPVFSVKDRVALKMIEKAEEAGLVREDTVFVEATSGNTGIGLAAVCAARGYKLVIIMPENMSQERIKLMRHFGTEVILTPAEDGMMGSINKAEILAEKNPAVLLLRQFENEANPDAHKFGTSIEILEDTGGDVDCLVSAVGTAGTVSGIASALRTYNPELYVAAVEPAASPVLNGGKAGPHKIQGIGAGFIPKTLDTSVYDEIIKIENDDAFEEMRNIAFSEGILVGISSGAALKAADILAKRPENKGKTIVVLLPDSGDRYLSTPVFAGKK